MNNESLCLSSFNTLSFRNWKQEEVATEKKRKRQPLQHSVDKQIYVENMHARSIEVKWWHSRHIVCVWWKQVNTYLTRSAGRIIIVIIQIKLVIASIFVIVQLDEAIEYPFCVHQRYLADSEMTMKRSVRLHKTTVIKMHHAHGSHRPEFNGLVIDIFFVRKFEIQLKSQHGVDTVGLSFDLQSIEILFEFTCRLLECVECNYAPDGMHSVVGSYDWDWHWSRGVNKDIETVEL